MKLEALISIQVSRLQRAIEEFKQAEKWREKLAHWKEIRLYERELSATIERLENLVADDFRRQTGLKAIFNYWKRLPGDESPQSQAKS